ncbi:MAG: hypothetical protein IPO83_00870 [Chitinophagaceae bacterium]|nr:hypothetical protein [Chitinophagaceae bacterium]
MNALIQQFGDTDVLYVIFGIVVLLFLVLDIGILQRSDKPMTVKSALFQTGCWVSIAFAYGYLVYHFHGTEKGLQYISAYLMEYSLSADNLLFLYSYSPTLKYRINTITRFCSMELSARWFSGSSLYFSEF